MATIIRFYPCMHQAMDIDQGVASLALGLNLIFNIFFFILLSYHINEIKKHTQCFTTKTWGQLLFNLPPKSIYKWFTCKRRKGNSGTNHVICTISTNIKEKNNYFDQCYVENWFSTSGLQCSSLVWSSLWSSETVDENVIF